MPLSTVAAVLADSSICQQAAQRAFMLARCYRRHASARAAKTTRLGRGECRGVEAAEEPAGRRQQAKQGKRRVRAACGSAMVSEEGSSRRNKKAGRHSEQEAVQSAVVCRLYRRSPVQRPEAPVPTAPALYTARCKPAQSSVTPGPFIRGGERSVREVTKRCVCSVCRGVLISLSPKHTADAEECKERVEVCVSAGTRSHHCFITVPE